MNNKTRKKSGCLPFILLLLLAALLRICRLATLPLEMHIDEAGLGLNAWSMAHFGTDRYGNFMPVCPSNFYGEQSAFYTCFCALLVKLFGLNLYTLRLPGAIMGILTVLFGALLMREKWGSQGLYTGLVLLGIFPYFIMNSRFALDCNAMLGAVTIALYGIVRLVKKAEENTDRKWYGYFALTGLLFGIVLYTYIIAAIVIALFCVFFGLYYLFYKKDGRALRFRQLFFLALPLALMAVPLILVFCVNYFDWEPVVTPFFSVPKMVENRTQEIGLASSSLPGKLRGLLHTLTSDGKYGSSDRYWTMYWWSVPLTGAGVLFSVRNAIEAFRSRKFCLDIWMMFLAVSEGIMFLLCGQYNYHINGVFIALAYFCVNGILSALALTKKTNLKTACGLALACLYAGTFLGFVSEYYGVYPALPYRVYGGASEAISLLSDEQKTGNIYVLDEVGEFYFLSHPIPPSEFTAACDEMGYVRDYGNLHFYEPESYGAEDVIVCSKASGRYSFFSDVALAGYAYSVLETDYYYVFYVS